MSNVEEQKPRSDSPFFSSLPASPFPCDDGGTGSENDLHLLALSSAEDSKEDAMQRQALLKATSSSADEWSALLTRQFAPTAPFSQSSVASASSSSSSFSLLAPTPFARTPLELKYAKFCSHNRVIPATLLLRLFRIPKSPTEFRVFDPKIDGRSFEGGVVYSVEQRLPELDKQKPFLFMLLHPLLQFLCVDLCRRGNGTSSISPEYIFGSISSAHGGVLVRLTPALFPFEDPITDSSKNLGNLLCNFSELPLRQPSAFSRPSASASTTSVPPLSASHPMLRASSRTRSFTPVVDSASQQQEKESRLHELYEEQLKRRDESIAGQFKSKSAEFCAFLANPLPRHLVVSGSEFASASVASSSSLGTTAALGTGRRVATSLVGLCMYELNRGPTFALYSSTSSSTSASSSSSISSYMHVSVILADRLAKSSGVLAFVICLRLARRLQIPVVLEAVDRRGFKGEYRDDLIGMYSSKFGFSEMAPEHVTALCEKPEKGVVFMILLPDFSPSADIAAYEQFLVSLISPSELIALETASEQSLPRVFAAERLTPHNVQDNAPSICKEQMGRLQFKSTLQQQQQQHQTFPSAPEFLRSCSTFLRSAPVSSSSASAVSAPKSLHRARSSSGSSLGSAMSSTSPDLQAARTSPFFSLDDSAATASYAEAPFAAKLRSLERESKLSQALAIFEREKEAAERLKQNMERDRDILQARMQELENRQSLEAEKLIAERAEREAERREREAERLAERREREAERLAERESFLRAIEESKTLQTQLQTELETAARRQEALEESAREALQRAAFSEMQTKSMILQLAASASSSASDSSSSVPRQGKISISKKRARPAEDSASSSSSSSSSASAAPESVLACESEKKIAKASKAASPLRSISASNSGVYLCAKGKYSSPYLSALNPGLFNPFQVFGTILLSEFISSTETLSDWNGNIVRETFNPRCTYEHGVTPLDVSRTQGLRGEISKTSSGLVLVAKTTLDKMFGKTRFQLFFDADGKFLRGFELRLSSNDKLGWIEQ